MIKKIEDKFILFSKDGKKRLGEFSSKIEAEEREKEIMRIKRTKALEMFKSDRDKRNTI